MNFRYNIVTKNRISVFEPAKLKEPVDPLSMRATQMGAFLKGNYNRLPRTEMSSLLWEAARLQAFIDRLLPLCSA